MENPIETAAYRPVHRLITQVIDGHFARLHIVHHFFLRHGSYPDRVQCTKWAALSRSLHHELRSIKCPSIQSAALQILRYRPSTTGHGHPSELKRHTSVGTMRVGLVF